LYRHLGPSMSCIAPSLCFLLRRDVLCFGSNEAPDFIALEAAHAHVANALMVELLTGAA